MRTSRSARGPRASRRAAILIDYDNLHEVLSEHLSGGGPTPVSAYVLDAVEELRRYLLDADSTPAACLHAYGDFEALADDEPELEQTLYLHGIEPRYAPLALQPNAAELRLCVDAVDLLHREARLRTFVLVTGDRTYLPLLQKLRARGCQALVVTLDGPDADAPESRAYGDVFMDLLNLLDDEARADILHGAGRRNSFGSAEAPDPREYEAITNPVAVRTLEVTEEHFGQYDEVYLTPLLRKLSEVLGEQHDPKALVSDLEAARAVRLEKRDGYPHDYTVLILHRDHPAVQEAREHVRRAAPSRSSASYVEDEYEAEDDYETDDGHPNNDYDGTNDYAGEDGRPPRYADGDYFDESDRA